MLNSNKDKLLSFNWQFIDFLNHGSVVVEILGKHDLELQSFHHQPYLQSTNDRHSREDEITLSRYT